MALPRPVSPPTLVEHIVAELTERILSGSEAFRPGTHLRIAMLTEMFRTSPTPIKEALRQLHAQGLVMITPRHGAAVAQMSRRDYEEIFTLRGELEPLALRLAPSGLDRAVLEEIGTVVEAMREAVAAARTVEYHQLDCNFHRLVVRLGRNGRLAGFYDDLLAQYRMRPAYMSTTPAGMAQSLREHVSIQEALLAEDLERAQTLVADHYSHARMRSEPSTTPADPEP